MVEMPSESNLDEPIVLEDKPAPQPPANKSGKIAALKARWAALSRNQKWLAGGGTALFLIVLAAALFLVFGHKKTIPKVHPVTKVTKSTTVASPLSGVQVPPDVAKRPVTGIMIENSLDARPQSGLGSAGIVFEAIAEAGITRFLALYQDTAPSYIGPVRSLRPYFIDWAAAFDASIAHVGGSPDALAQIRSGGKDLDQFFNAGAYWRIGSRYAPHNVYTSFDKLDALNEAKGYTTSTFTPWLRKADHKFTPTAAHIDFAISSADYNVHYDYEPGPNTYARSEGGSPHTVTSTEDPSSAAQMEPKVVIALIVPLKDGALDASGAYYSDYNVNGSNTMYVFQDGVVTQGTWTKDSRASQFVFKDMNGQPLKLNAGQTWVSVLSNANQVSYTP